MNLDFIKNISKKIPGYQWVCFISGIVTGLLTHLYMLTHKLPNWDDLWNIDGFGSGDYLGRWFLKFIYPIGNQYSVPVIHGIIGIFFLSLSACLIMEILHLKSITSAVLIPAILLTFPSVTSTMTFMFTFQLYCIAFFMACFAIYLAEKYKWGLIPCSFLLILMLGCYQPYIAMSITLILCSLIFGVLQNRFAFSDVLKKGIGYVVMLLVTVLIYMGLCHLFYPNLNDSTYGGIGDMGQISLLQMPHLIGRCYKRVLDYFILKPFSFINSGMHIMQISACVILGILFVYLIIKKKIFHNIWTLLLSIIIMALMPFAMAFVYFMAPNADYSMLMFFPYSMVFIIVLGFLEESINIWKEEKVDSKIFIVYRLCSVVIPVFISLIIFSNYKLDNEAYFRMDISFQRAQSYYERIMSRIEDTEGYQYGDDVLILGEFYFVDNPSPIEANSIMDDSFRELSGVAMENGLITSGIRANFVRTYLGFDMATLPETQVNEIMESKEYKNLPCFPDQNCVIKINNVWVIKLCD